jgi:hypothetical protein
MVVSFPYSSNCMGRFGNKPKICNIQNGAPIQGHRWGKKFFGMINGYTYMNKHHI